MKHKQAPNRTRARGLFLTLLVAIVCVGGCARPKAAPKPNILLIVVDTARADRFSCYGYPKPTTPNVDRLAAEGARFEEAYATGPWTIPSHASLFTGLFSREHGMTCENWTLAENHVTLAERLARAGYRTLGYSGNPWVSKQNGLGRGFDTFIDVWRKAALDGQGEAARLTNQYVRMFFDNAYDGNQPFFLFINYFEPHLNYNPPEPFKEKFLPAGAPAEMVERLRKMGHPVEVGYIFKKIQFSPQELSVFNGLYDGEIATVDSAIGELVDSLKAKGILERTVVIVTADHGENIGDHQMMDHKFCVYDTLLHLPLVIRYPPVFPAGSTVRHQVQILDLYRTVLELAGAADGVKNSSISLVPGSDGWEKGRPYAFAEFGRPFEFFKTVQNIYPDLDLTYFDRRLKAARTPKWKYVWSSNGAPELFEVARDPGETSNVAATELKAVGAMHEALEDWAGTKFPRAAP